MTHTFKVGDRLIQTRFLVPNQSKYVTVVEITGDHIRHRHDGEEPPKFKNKNCESSCFKEIGVGGTSMSLAIEEAVDMLRRHK